MAPSTDNSAVWGSRRAAESYRFAAGLLAPERSILDGLDGPSRLLATSRLLDIGIGTGRTTEALSGRVGTYVGIDYSTEMVAICKQRFPNVDVRSGDARDLSSFASGHFDLVMFSFNGIDYLDHSDRLRALAEINRVLKPTGVFVFSFHRRGVEIAGPWAVEHIRLSKNPINVAKSVVGYFRGIRNHARMRAREVTSPEYALLNDGEQSFSMLTYYITPSAQRRQLADAGFECVGAYLFDGRKLPDEFDDNSVEDFMIYIVARKA